MNLSTQSTAFIARGLTKGGVGRFVESVLAEWDKQPQKNKNLIIFTDERTFVTRYPKLKIVYIRRAPKLFWDNYLLLRQLLKHMPKSVIYTKNAIPVTHLSTPWKKITIVYDLGFFYPELDAYRWLDTFYMKFMTRWTLKFSDVIIAISEFTKKEIIKLLNIPAAKIKVIYLGVSNEFSRIHNQRKLDAVIKSFNLKLPFVFYNGSLSPRKNILRLIQAFELAKNQISHHLYLVAGKRWNSQEVLDYIEEHQLSDRVHLLPFISEKDLVGFYSLATAFVYPSLYEGFGLPIIEAQSCECPVITSNTTSCLEISQNSALLINPQSVHELSEAILKLTLAKDNKYLVHKGQKNAQRFSWEFTSNNLIKETT